MSLRILHEDERLLFVDKPSGMLVHRGWATDDIVLVDLVREHVGRAHPIHRIDRATSGVILFARDADTARVLNAQFDARTVRKTYVALVRGVAPESGLIDHPVPRTEGGERVDAQTRFHRLAAAQTQPRDVSLVEASPITGRFHQIRRHLKHIDHPIIGDANYGKGPLNRAFRERYGLERLALHAASLEIEHPDSGSRLVIEAKIPDDLREPLAAMGFELP